VATTTPDLLESDSMRRSTGGEPGRDHDDAGDRTGRV
jgi:hypothetical protein